ncbi:tail fiber domain-containing protein [Roseivirga sp. BDSF3-8]|uniref:tail fiber domain-containing protein n=1 Tax=Roseivirga sp. BDSF3-8 TaxID=3241598 RepID=UPI0035325259
MKKRLLTLATGLGVLLSFASSPGYAQWTFSGTNIYNTNSGNVGIGTTTPATDLEIVDRSPILRIRSNSAPSPAILETNASGVSGFFESIIDPWVGVRIRVDENRPFDILTNDISRVTVTGTGNVGIGTRNPLNKLQVQGGNVSQVSSGSLGDPNSKWSALGAPPSAFPTGGDYFGLFHNWEQQNFVTGLLDNGTKKDGLIAWQDQTSSSTTSGTRLRIGFIKGFGTGTSNPATFSEKMTILANGNVGINLTNPFSPLDVDGDIRSRTGLRVGSVEEFTDGGANTFASNATIRPTGTFQDLGTSTDRWDFVYCVTLNESSDKRLKKDIKKSEYGLDHIMQIRPVSYKLRDKGNSAKVELGFIAQELYKIIPEVVSNPATEVHMDENGNEVVGNPDGMMGISYTRMIPVLVQAIQDLKAENDELRAIVENSRSASEADTEGEENNRSGIADPAGALVPRLLQNRPNPFNTETVIEYELPQNVNSAILYIYDMNGRQIRKVDLRDRGKGEFTLDGSVLRAGMYLYSLIADGKEVDTKRMILTD